VLINSNEAKEIYWNDQMGSFADENFSCTEMIDSVVLSISSNKKPAKTKDAFSATLFSGAKYRYDSPQKWPKFVQLAESMVPVIREKLGNYDIPLIWTADFILDTDKKTKKDKYILGEINASCVGFSTHLELSENIADEVLNLLDAESVVNNKWGAFTK